MRIKLTQKLIKREQAKFNNNLNDLTAIYAPFQINLNNQIGADYALTCSQENEVDSEIEKGIGILEIEGHIGSLGWFGGIDEDYVEDSLEKLKLEGNVKHIILKINSGGGSVYATDEIIRVIKEFKKENPEIQFTTLIDKCCASAGYLIACQAEKIYSIPTTNEICSSIIGSIGVKLTRVDMTGRLEKDKITVNNFVSAEKKNWGDPDSPMSEEEKAFHENRVNEMATSFFNQVSQARNIPANTVESWKAGVFNNNEALANGLIDGILTEEELILKLKNDMLENANPPLNLEDMSDLQKLIDETVELKVQLSALQKENAELKASASVNPLEEQNTKLKAELDRILQSKKQEALATLQLVTGKTIDENNADYKAIMAFNSVETVEAYTANLQTALQATKKPIQAASELNTEEFDAKKLMPKIQLKDGGVL